jgi:hypothetical protein
VEDSVQIMFSTDGVNVDLGKPGLWRALAMGVRHLQAEIDYPTGMVFLTAFMPVLPLNHPHSTLVINK